MVLKTTVHYQSGNSWKQLEPEYRDSNWTSVEHMQEKLCQLPGYSAIPGGVRFDPPAKCGIEWEETVAIEMKEPA